MLVVFLIVWVAGLVFGYGLLFDALADQVRPRPGFGAALYFAGTSLLTIGYGEFVPLTGAARFLALAAGASGFGTVAVVTAFLFSLFGAFSRREVFVILFGARAGAPPSGRHPVGVERSEFDTARERLRDAGFDVIDVATAPGRHLPRCAASMPRRSRR